MPSINFQTVNLSRGKHKSPDEGACVMELASMLSGEPFTDRPSSVCPVIGSFLRAYNDSLDNERRQDLYRYAAKIVGTRASTAVQRARADRLATWAVEMRRRRWARSFLSARFHAVGIERRPPMDTAGIHAVRSMPRVTDATHAAALALIDELIMIGHEQKSRRRSKEDRLATTRLAGR
jgi:hypothetical protein